MLKSFCALLYFTQMRQVTFFCSKKVCTHKFFKCGYLIELNWIDPFNSIRLFYARILLCPFFCNSVFSFSVSHATIKTHSIKEAICASDIANFSAQKHNFLTLSKNEFTMWLKVQFLNFSSSFCNKMLHGIGVKKLRFCEWFTLWMSRS